LSYMEASVVGLLPNSLRRRELKWAILGLNQ
jgi:hypothetical protein